MDLTNPKTRAFVAEEVRQISEKWGAKYFKIDGLWTGLAIQILYINDAYKPDDIGKQTFCDSNVTNVQAYRSGLNLVRESAGGDAFLMGCVASQNMRTLGASYGSLMRGMDTIKFVWKGIRVRIRSGMAYFYNDESVEDPVLFTYGIQFRLRTHVRLRVGARFPVSCTRSATGSRRFPTNGLR